MGIYPDRRIVDRQRNAAGGEFWEEIETQPGLMRRRLVIAHPWVETRTDCYCCSCGDREGSDPDCRNHGFAGERPCEVHEMPGKADERGYMPASVQARVRELHGDSTT